MDTCNQCRKVPATVYAIDPYPGGWGGRYCRPCAKALGFMVVDVLVPPTQAELEWPDEMLDRGSMRS